MDIRSQISLKNYTTMKLGGDARFMAVATTREQVRELYQNSAKQGVKVFVLGGGSNTIVTDEGFDGLVLLNRIKGFDIVEDDQSTVQIRIGSGESWDDIVARAIDMGLSGIEAMSGIPGTAGAAPVQNIGAYGQELADTIVSLEVYDSVTDSFLTMYPEECQFSYRDSIFRREHVGRFCIVSITLKLYRASPRPPFYAALQKYLDDRMITIFTPQTIREAVLDIRRLKLPDPKDKPNTGSFFKNPVIEDWQFQQLQSQHPEVPYFDMPGGNYKIPAGWLIEQAGFKGELLYDSIRVYDKNALILVNEAATSYRQLSQARSQIVQTVLDKFRIQLEQEPLEI